LTTTDQAGIEMCDVRLKLGTHSFRFDGLFPSGEVIAITGPSGAGKSTLLNLLAGFETPDAGAILIAGHDVTGTHPAKRPISLVFQDNNLFAHLDVFTNIGLGIDPAMKLSPADLLSISAALEKVGLAGLEKRMPATLSGGERQRVAFARALVRRRPVLLLDEPFAALDPALRTGMADLLLDLHRETGNTVVIVSHDPDEVRRIADYALFIDGGTIALSAPLAEFTRREDVSALQLFLRG
jgi:thiamine transport system ATP-binding protein